MGIIVIAVISASNIATQNWAFEPITDPDQLRRLYDLYNFAVAGNASKNSQDSLVTDYPLPYKTTTTGQAGNTTTSLEPDLVAMSGPNCVVCYVPKTNGNCPSGTTQRKEGDSSSVCIQLNPRLLPENCHCTWQRCSWLRWTNLAGNRPSDQGREPLDGDGYLGQRGPYLLYVDKYQADRFAEFSLLVAAAASSTLNPSASAASSGANGKQPKAFAIPSSIIIGPVGQ
jgi:hypothetical protein